MFESAIAIDASKAFKAYEGMLKDIVHVAFEQESETTKLSAMLAMELCLQTKPRCPDDMLMVIKNDAEWFKENGYKDRAERLKARINKALEQ
jgi:hypothetical protein